MIAVPVRRGRQRGNVDGEGNERKRGRSNVVPRNVSGGERKSSGVRENDLKKKKDRGS